METWKSVVGYENSYEISDHGRVRSLHFGGRILKPDVRKNGYMLVTLSHPTKSKKVLIHRLVYGHFCGELVNGLCVCHNDGDPSNNHVNNLRQDTQKSNIKDKKRHGTYLCGVGLTWTKLSESDVKRILSDDRSNMDIALDYGVTRQNISSIKQRKTWSHINVT